MGTVGNELRYCKRAIAIRPRFATIVVLTLALGIGMTCAIFSVVNAVLLQPLPYPEPDRLVVVVIRSDSPLTTVGSLVQDQIRQFDPRLPVWDIKPLSEVPVGSLAVFGLSTLMMAVFAAAALLLAAVGIFGVMSFMVSSRTRETGVRLALGAERRDIFKLMIGRGMVLVLIGMAVGLVAALALSRMIESLLFGITPSDPLTLSAVCLVLIGVALLACYLPARRAARIEPVEALRHE